MREMKNSGIEWIDEIPVDWDILPTKRFFRNVKRVAGKDAENFERLALTLNGVIKRSKTDNEGLQPEQFESYQVLKENEMVFKLIDLENVKTSRVGLSSYTGLVSPAYIVLTNENKDNRFYYYWFISMYYNEVFNHLGGSGVRSALNAKDLLNIPAPNLNEYERKSIADFLDEKCAKIDAVIEKQKQVIEKLKEYKLSVITEAVTKGLDPIAPMKDSGVEWIGEIPEEWNLVKLKYAINKIGDIDHYMPESVDEGIPYLMTGDLKENVSSINFNACKKVSAEDYQALCKKMSTQKGDIIFARYATIGTVAYVDVECDFLVSYSCVTIRVNKRKLNGKYLFFYLKSKTFFEEVKKYINANTQGNVGIDSLNKVRMPLPPIDTQKTVVDYIERKSNEIDLAIAKKQVIVEKLTEYKKSLIYEVVTGKREV